MTIVYLRYCRLFFFLLLTLFLLAGLHFAHAGIVRGTVTDTLGAPVAGADVALISGGKAVAAGRSKADGSYSLSTGESGRFYLAASGKSFRQLQTPGFYAGQLSTIEQNIMLEPEWVHQEIVVTATGTPLPAAQVSSSITTLQRREFENRTDLVAVLRLQPGVELVQSGQRGAQTSMFVRGGNSDSNNVTYDGVSAVDIGGQYDFGNLATTSIESAEVYRGPNSVVYGTGASSSVVNLTTPRGTTASPSLFYTGDAGNFGTYRNEVQLGGSRKKLDYYGGLSRLDTANSLPDDKYHLVTAAANLGWALTPSTQIRGTLRNGGSATGVPNAHDFYGLSDDRKQSDQDLYVGATIDSQATAVFHNMARYGLTRKREQSQQWYPSGIFIPQTIVDVANFINSGGNYYGSPVTIKGANGYAVSGQALLNYSTVNFGVYPNRLDLVSNRDQLQYEGDYHLTPHFTALIGFRFENERGTEREPAYFLDKSIERTNYDYNLLFQGDFKGRLFYSLGGGLQKNQVFGTEANPRIGLSYYAVKPGSGWIKGTKLNFDYSEGVQEPTLGQQLGSLFTFLKGQTNGGDQAIQQFRITPIAAPHTRSYDGGLQQAFFSERVTLRATYFHNEFGRQIESVGVGVLPQLLPQLTSAQQQALESYLAAAGAFSLDLNSGAYSAQGAESEIEYGIGHRIFLRGGYTYLDAKVQHSFSSDALSPTYNTGLFGGVPPSFSTVPIGIYSPLRGARPFRRPPHTGFAAASYSGKGWSAEVTGAFAGRSDDSTFLGYSDLQQGNSLLLPNRNLDHGFAEIDAGGSYQLRSWVTVFAQMDNLLSSQHIAPIGFPSLPLTFRSGVKLALGRGVTR